MALAENIEKGNEYKVDTRESEKTSGPDYSPNIPDSSLDTKKTTFFVRIDPDVDEFVESNIREYGSYKVIQAEISPSTQGRRPVADSYPPEIIDEIVARYCEERGIEAAEPLISNCQQGGLSRAYMGYELVPDSRKPNGKRIMEYFIKAALNGDPEIFQDEGEIHLDISAKTEARGKSVVPACYPIDNLLLDNGTVLPIIVMEMIHGDNLEEYLEAGSLTREQKSEMFRYVLKRMRKESLQEHDESKEEMLAKTENISPTGYRSRRRTTKAFFERMPTDVTKLEDEALIDACFHENTELKDSVLEMLAATADRMYKDAENGLQGMKQVVDAQEVKKYAEGKERLRIFSEALARISEPQRLRQYLEKDQLSRGEKLNIFDQLLEMVEEVHKAGYAHRDIKPKNFLIRDGKVLCVLDLGIASKLGQPPKNKMINGTPEYMSPDHIYNKVDHRMDIYSLGCVLYQMITGRTPHTYVVDKYANLHRDFKAFLVDMVREMGAKAGSAKRAPTEAEIQDEVRLFLKQQTYQRLINEIMPNSQSGKGQGTDTLQRTDEIAARIAKRLHGPIQMREDATSVVEEMLKEDPYKKMMERYEKSSGDITPNRMSEEFPLRLYQSMIDEKHITHPSDDVKDSIKRLSQDLTFIVDHCLKSNPEERFQNCEAISNALRKVIEEDMMAEQVCKLLVMGDKNPILPSRSGIFSDYIPGDEPDPEMVSLVEQAFMAAGNAEDKEKEDRSARKSLVFKTYHKRQNTEFMHSPQHRKDRSDS